MVRSRARLPAALGNGFPPRPRNPPSENFEMKMKCVAAFKREALERFAHAAVFTLQSFHYPDSRRTEKERPASAPRGDPAGGRAFHFVRRLVVGAGGVVA